ncbi:MAG: GDSL-type esterase/lipase family protein [Gemmatimonadota bacterium]|nr:GDSL-type esterase/lipase family protein [Gemmatimonadota bacterium]
MANTPLVVLIGDSIRMGYQDHVISQLAGRAEVWSPEENGGDSRNVLAHLDQWVLARQPDLVHVNCGLHDLKRAFGAASEVPLAEYEGNVRQILQRLQRELNGAVVWATTTPVDEPWHHQNKGFDRLEADVDAYNAAARAVAEDLGVPIDDLFAVVEREGKAQLLTQDGVHFTEEGSQLLGRVVAECVWGHLSAR